MNNLFVKDLISKMTLDEKLGQLTQRGGSIYTPELKINEEIRGQIKDGYIGSFLSVCGPDALNEMQRVAVEESRLKIPLFFGHDIIHGYRTIFPIPAGEACSFEPELAKRTAKASAEEMRANGIHITWAPMVDIARDQRWGRGLEGAGEDVYVNKVFARARVEGFHNNGIDKQDSVACCAKHFVAYGAVEGGRDYNTVDMSDSKLYNTYLPPFKEAIDAGVDFIMTGFHEFNGVPCTVNKRLLKDILRDEMGFKGIVISDSASLYFVTPHGYAENDEDLCAQAINGGLDIEMSTQIYHSGMKSALEKNRVTIEQIDEAVYRVLEFKYKLGLFENPYINVETANKALLKPESIELSRDVAKRSMVLLENNGVLPLKNFNKKIAVIGKIAADKKITLGSWVVAEVDKAVEHAVTVLEGVSKAFNKEKVKYSAAYDFITDNATQIQMQKEGNYDYVFTDDKMVEDAIKVARDAELVIFVAGEPNVINGEAKSRTDISVPAAQMRVLKELKKLNKKIITIIVAGRPLLLEEIKNVSDAVIFTYSLGSQMGNAVADVLTGVYNPSARLTSTFPRVNGQCGTMYYSHNNTGQPADEDVWFTSKYVDVKNGPLYCFGYGLSYTDFRYKNISTDRMKYKCNDEIIIEVDIENTGEYDGEEVVQIYVRDCVGTIVRPVKELKSFKKVMVKKGECKKITFKIKVRELGFYNSDNKYVIEDGRFIITAAHDSMGGISKEVYVEG